MKLLRTVVVTALVCLPAIGALAADYPDRTIEITVTFAPGGTPDVLARALAEGMSSALHQPVVVINRLGAAGAIGGSFVSRAKPDGYTLLFAPALISSVVPIIQENVGYTPQSFTPICQTFETQMALVVRPDSPFHTVGDIVRAAKERPASLSYGHAGVGSIPHLAMIELANAAEAKFNAIPFKGDAEVIAPLLGGHVDFAPMTLSSVPRGALRILGIFANVRNPGLPEVPTVKEQGFDVAPTSFGGLLGPAGLPEDVKVKLAAACRTAAETPLYLETARRALLGKDMFADSAAFARRLDADIKEKREILRSLGYRR
ncbi:MAG TPA: tripartite tricarboxylate transporter substrate binding protein [Xanthobacteraceae bacterium]|nr:tripartite tricarboxylate transporter substrate binding protein [Xanthobacteraceae bacterium]